MLHQFGFAKFDDIRREYRDRELVASTPENSLFFQSLASRVKISVLKLKEYDENLIRFLNVINAGRPTPINLKYYQYFSLLFTEYYLDSYFDDRDSLLTALNRFVSSSTQARINSLPEYTETDLNKVAYWNATGSGKTFITHINILQLRHYAGKHGKSFKNLVLLTPSEDLSDQHLGELERSHIAAHFYWEGKDSPAVKVIDIHKIREFATGEGVTVPLSEFERSNAILVDEGHKGDKEDSQWRDVRSTLSEQGFAFEYSATFGQVRNEDLQDEYGKCIIFDYSYGHFFEDGYGKDYWIHNLTEDKKIEGAREKRYLLQNLLLFLQQKMYYTQHKEELRQYNIEEPLLIFVGTSVEPRAKGVVAEENKEVISDVKRVLDFINDLFSRRRQYVKWIDDLRENRGAALFRQDFWPKLEYLFRELPSADAIYDAFLSVLFHAQSPDGIELYTLRDAEGEIALKVKNADHYFALIYIGDTSTFKMPLEKEYEFKKDVTSSSLFQSLSDAQTNPVNLLIGARKFIEGWNNYRVSSIGLINFGRSKGSQIIQLFGRGVRLMGKGNTLRRSKGTAGSPPDIHISETLNIFGLRADYMKKFKNDLEREGIKTVKRQFKFEVKAKEDLNQLKLLTLERNQSKPAFETTAVFTLAHEPSVKVRLDISPRKFLAMAGVDELADDVETQSFRLADEELDIVDWDDIYLRLISYKAEKKYKTLHIPKARLKELFRSIDYRIISDNQIALTNLSDVEKLQKLVLEVLKRYVESYYKRKLQYYDGSYLTAVPLTADNPNIRDLQWEMEICTTDVQGNEFEDIRGVLKRIEELADPSVHYPDKLKDNNFILNTWLDAHLYQPLLKGDANREKITLKGRQLLDRMTPQGLNDGEVAFVEDLKNFIAGQSHRYPEYDFFLLRNMSRGTGFGFYFMAGGFYPDFMLWLRKKNAHKQYLSFIDPHGLRNESNGWSSERIMLHARIKEIEHRINNKDLILNSFILQPGTGFRGAEIDRWGREDDPQNRMPLDEYAKQRNVFEVPTEGNRTGPGSYIDLIVRRILS
jgi:hypothetical protein